MTPVDALAWSVAASREPMAAVDGAGGVIALFGVGRDPSDPAVGGPWLLGTDAMAARPLETMRLAKSELPRLAEGFDLLVNRADARNRLHLGWVRALGFVCLRAAPQGPERRLFVEFARAL